MAVAARRDGLAESLLSDKLEQLVDTQMGIPEYQPMRRAGSYQSPS